LRQGKKNRQMCGFFATAKAAAKAYVGKEIVMGWSA
jgi:hypothetical protein